MSDEPDFDESKEWEDLEGDELPPDDEDLIIESETEDDIPSDHGKGYKRGPKVDRTMVHTAYGNHDVSEK